MKKNLVFAAIVVSLIFPPWPELRSHRALLRMFLKSPTRVRLLEIPR